MARHVRLVVMLAVAATFLGAPAADVVARGDAANGARRARLDYPAPPQAGYRPAFVHQRYNNCAFASAQMLLDKWTGGRRNVAQERLRQATGIAPADGGPTLGQLSRAVAQVAGVDLRWSPNGGDPMTWHDLMYRLANGGGALVNLWPAKLPRHHRRWLPTLTAGHSVYVERYQPASDRLWIMDPLGRGRGFSGEWIDAQALSHAIWRTGDHVWAAATPVRPRPPALSDFELGQPVLAPSGFVDRQLEVSMGYTPRRFDAALPALRLSAHWELVAGQQDDAVSDAEAAGARERQAALIADGMRWPGPGSDAVASVEAIEDAKPLSFQALSEPLASDDAVLATELATPSVPGEYVVTLSLRDADGGPLAEAAPRYAPRTVRVYGPLAGSVVAHSVLPETVLGGHALSVTVDVTNLGSADWGADATPVALAASWDDSEAELLVPLTLPSGATEVVAFTVGLDTDADPATLVLSLVSDAGTVVDADALALTVDLYAPPPGAADAR